MFPEGFRWGVACSGHQTEGGNTRSDTWFLEHVRPTVFREPSGQACNSYELWREDVGLVAGLGLDTYRFSVEWARVEPAEGQFSAEALAHYRAIVDSCLAVGIATVVTFNHMTSPHWFARRGGWLDPRAPAVFARYCDVVTERLGDGIAWAVTLNEPNLPRLLSWLDIPDAVRELERATLLAASEQAGVPRYRVANVMLPEEMEAMADGMAAGHRAAREAIKARCPGLPVGFSVAIVDDQVVGDGVPVVGYLHWTLLDNFEWIFGYDVRLGLHEVDRETFVRRPKPSAAVYSAIARAHAVGAAEHRGRLSAGRDPAERVPQGHDLGLRVLELREGALQDVADRELTGRLDGSGAARGAEQSADGLVHRGVAPAAHDLAAVVYVQASARQRRLQVARRRQGVRSVVGRLLGRDERAHGLVYHRALRALGRREQAGDHTAVRANDTGGFAQRPPWVAGELERVDANHRVERGVVERQGLHIAFPQVGTWEPLAGYA